MLSDPEHPGNHFGKFLKHVKILIFQDFRCCAPAQEEGAGEETREPAGPPVEDLVVLGEFVMKN